VSFFGDKNKTINHNKDNNNNNRGVAYPIENRRDRGADPIPEKRDDISIARKFSTFQLINQDLTSKTN